MTYHVLDVLLKCQRIMDIAHTSIEKKVFLKGYEARDILYAIMEEAQTALQYMRQRRNRGLWVRHTQ